MGSVRGHGGFLEDTRGPPEDPQKISEDLPGSPEVTREPLADPLRIPSGPQRISEDPPRIPEDPQRIPREPLEDFS